MSVAAYVLIATMIAVYILLDGYDLGIGAINLFVGKTSDERAATMASIGPFWNGNEVWLIATAGALFALFPQAYASAFSGFYLPFIVVLWLLMFRGIAVELRNHFVNELWTNFFDACFTYASALLIFLFGVAIGNIVRGVPLDANHYFIGTFAFLLNPYALGVGILAVVALAQHGAAFLRLRVDGPPAQRATRLVSILWPIVLSLFIIVTAATFVVHSPLPIFIVMPILFVMPIAAFVGLVGVRLTLRSGRPRAAFNYSALFVGGLVGSAAATLYPYLLPGYPSATTGLSVFADVPTRGALVVSSSIIAGGLIAVAIYQSIVAYRIGGKINC
jgi:cytochrome d ubiquinol oxidase subunit II